MKNNTFKNIAILLGVFMFTPNFAVAKSPLPPEFKVIFAKFSIAMIGVALFSILIYISLSLYNKFFVSENIKNAAIRNNSFSSPRDKQEAIMNFISRNRLK